MISLLPKIGKDLGIEFFMQNLNKYLLKSLNDLIHAVRTEAILAISSLAEVFSQDWIEKNIFLDVINRSNSDCYINRVTSINILLKISKKINFDLFGDQILNLICNLSKDKVVNVRICVAELCRTLLKLGISLSHQTKLKEFIKILQNDEDQDVRMIANNLFI